MNEHHAGSGDPKYGAKNVGGVDGTGADASLSQEEFSEGSAPGIEGQGEKVLPLRVGQAGAECSIHVATASNRSMTREGACGGSAAELGGGNDTRCFGEADACKGGDLGDWRLAKADEPTGSGKDMASDFDGGTTAMAGSEKNGDQFDVAERGRAVLGDAFAAAKGARDRSGAGVGR